MMMKETRKMGSGVAGFTRTATAGKGTEHKGPGSAGMRTPPTHSHITGFKGKPPATGKTFRFGPPQSSDMPHGGRRS